MLEEELKGIPQIMPSANCACSFYFADKIRPVMNPEDKMILKNCSFFFFFFSCKKMESRDAAKNSSVFY